MSEPAVSLSRSPIQCRSAADHCRRLAPGLCGDQLTCHRIEYRNVMLGYARPVQRPSGLVNFTGPIETSLKQLRRQKPRSGNDPIRSAKNVVPTAFNRPGPKTSHPAEFGRRARQI
jgi:hypothetical protein